MLKILDTIRQANVESITEYECYSCGRFSEMDDTNYRTWRSRDDGEVKEAQVCDRCLSLGFDEWNR